VEAKNIKIDLLLFNTGQIVGLPSNPRFIRDEEFECLKKSIQEYPEMLNLREMLVVPFKKKYVVIAGNMRLRACSELGYTELPCKILPRNTDSEKLRAYTIKDNVMHGQWDFSKLAEWDVSELSDWGNIEIPEVSDADLAKFFEEKGEHHQGKGPKTMKCPHCGEEIEL